MNALERLRERMWGRIYFAAALLAFPLNLMLALLLRRRVRPGSVVHVAAMVHIPWQFVETLKAHGVDATYVAIGDNPHWDRCDVHLPHLASPLAALLRDMRVLWTVVARHQVIHCHCMMGVSHYQWELPLLKLMGRRVVAHFRGCEGRDGVLNMRLHPEVNICQECDYRPLPLCEYRENRRRRRAARRWADAILVTTPDMLDFFPEGEHLPFFLPPDPAPVPPRTESWTPGCGRRLRLVHVTNQPGIEGTRAIGAVVERLAVAGRPIEFIHLTGRSHAAVMAALAQADLAVGKMKMGYYANAQIESLMVGTPTITWVRDDLMTPALAGGGFIFSTLDGLAETLEGLLADPALLAEKRRAARESVLRLHAAAPIVARLRAIYGFAPCVSA